MFIFLLMALPSTAAHTSICNTNTCLTFIISVRILLDVDRHHRVDLLTESIPGSFAIIQPISNFSQMLEWAVE